MRTMGLRSHEQIPAWKPQKAKTTYSQNSEAKDPPNGGGVGGGGWVVGVVGVVGWGWGFWACLEMV